MYARAAVNFFFISINLQRSMLNSIKMKYARIKGARQGQYMYTAEANLLARLTQIIKKGGSSSSSF
jgi:hypothetical protein